MAKFTTLSDGRMTEFKRVLAQAGMTAELAETLMSLPEVAHEWVTTLAEEFGSCLRVGVLRGPGTTRRIERELFVSCGRSLAIGSDPCAIEVSESGLPAGFPLVRYCDAGWELCMPRGVTVRVNRIMGYKKDGEKILSHYDHENIQTKYGTRQWRFGRRHLPFRYWTLRLQVGDSGRLEFSETCILFQVVKSNASVAEKKATVA